MSFSAITPATEQIGTQRSDKARGVGTANGDVYIAGTLGSENFIVI